MNELEQHERIDLEIAKVKAGLEHSRLWSGVLRLFILTGGAVGCLWAIAWTFVRMADQPSLAKLITILVLSLMPPTGALAVVAKRLKDAMEIPRSIDQPASKRALPGAPDRENEP